MTPRLMLTLGVALVALVMAVVFATAPQRRNGEAVIAVLPTAEGIREGTPINYLGIAVGTVQALRLHERRVVAELRMHHPDVELRTADSLHWRAIGLFGDRVLDIIPGPRTAPRLGPGDTLFARSPENREGSLETLRRFLER